MLFNFFLFFFWWWVWVFFGKSILDPKICVWKSCLTGYSYFKTLFIASEALPRNQNGKLFFLIHYSEKKIMATGQIKGHFKPVY